MKVGITGANGFIGTHLTRYVAELGHQPIAFLKTGTPAETIRGVAHRIHHGDTTNRDTLAPFLRDCDVVFNLAGLNAYWALQPHAFHDANVVGARTVATGCIEHDIARLVHVSSCITLGASREPTPRDEAAEYNLGEVRFAYAETKRAGEEIVRSLIRRAGLRAVIVYPTSAIGELDHGPTPIGKPIADMCRGRWPAYVAGGACFIDVRDVVRGLWLAMEKGRIGEGYLLAGDNLSNREFMTRVLRLAGRGAPRVRVPGPLLDAIARAGELYADKVSRKHPPLTVAMASVIGRFLYFDGAKARRELGFQAGPCDDAIRRCMEWFRATGRV